MTNERRAAFYRHPVTIATKEGKKEEVWRGRAEGEGETGESGEGEGGGLVLRTLAEAIF